MVFYFAPIIAKLTKVGSINNKVRQEVGLLHWLKYKETLNS